MCSFMFGYTRWMGTSIQTTWKITCIWFFTGMRAIMFIETAFVATSVRATYPITLVWFQIGMNFFVDLSIYCPTTTTFISYYSNKCTGFTDGSTTKRDQVNAPTSSTPRTCTSCAANYFATDNNNCVAECYFLI